MTERVTIRRPVNSLWPDDQEFWNRPDIKAVVSQIAQRWADRIDAEIAKKVYAEFDRKPMN